MILMAEFFTTDGHTQIMVPLMITPFSHQASPTITGNLFSDEAGAVLYGHYKMEYLLPNGDKLRLIANHDQKTVQLMLFTYQTELIKLLPGERLSSLIADLINKVHRYRIRSASYVQPLTKEQEQKLKIASECIQNLEYLLKDERKLKVLDHVGQEALRRKAISVIEHSRDQNILLANNPLVSEGTLGDCLYNARKTAQHYVFNRAYTVSPQDQMDFSKVRKKAIEKPCLVWDSELHIGHSSKDLDDALRVISDYYQLTPAPNLNNVAANRFAQVGSFFHKLWHDGRDWINHLATGVKPQHKTVVIQRLDGVTITKITPYYRLQGLVQRGYPSLNSLIRDLIKSTAQPVHAKNLKEAQKKLNQLGHGNWALIAGSQKILIRQENRLIQLSYFIKDGQFYPLPAGQDLYTLAQISKRHLYLPERISLRIKAFLSRIPSSFVNFYQSMKRFMIHDLHQDFVNHVHATHPRIPVAPKAIESPKLKIPKHDHVVHALENHGLLKNGQTIEEFILEQINQSPYVIARAKHLPSPLTYDNPFHRGLGIIRHIANIFIDTSERNPLLGSLAMAAYFYGGSAIIAPEILKSILTKLHLKGLIAGIEPTQKLAHLLNHGVISEAISASALYWQAAVASGNLDKFFVEAINILKEDPAEIAIIAALALSFGYGLTKAIPGLGNEMGDFPYTNYAALGAKSGAAVYDTIMHPGNDWFLGTCKWLCKGTITLGKLFIAPFLEGYYYGFSNGFINGWKKSGGLFVKVSKQTIVANMDFFLTLLTIPLLELSSLLIHVPFRGITKLLTKTLSILGSITPIGDIFLAFATRTPLENLLANFRLSPLYGFKSPFAHFSNNWLFNAGINLFRLLFLPPLQLIKNLVILPLIDIFSLTIRLGITVIDPFSRMIAYSLGQVICAFGRVWDRSVGFIFSSSAKGLTIAFNWMDNIAGNIKQNLVSYIEILRRYLYQWAFAGEYRKLHAPPLKDKEYYTPRRYELFPHNDSGCLLKMLLEETSRKVELSTNPMHSKLFSPSQKQSSAYSLNSSHSSETMEEQLSGLSMV